MPLIVNVLAEFEDKKGRSLQLHELEPMCQQLGNQIIKL
jgi:hypothetical protein